jgi:asparagine synthase (glutamine-hydrolysing)
MTDIATYLEGSILTKVDRASMAASLEVRAPLLDERILALTVAAGVRDGNLGCRKGALRALLSRHLSLDLFSGPKRGFGLPIDEWFRGSLRDVLMEYTSENRWRNSGLVDPQCVARIRDLHLAGQRDYGRKLHALVAWEIWREKVGL